jgi:hypothetical protein
MVLWHKYLTLHVLLSACAVKTRTDQGPAGMYSRNPSWALPLTSFGPWGPTSGCKNTFDSVERLCYGLGPSMQHKSLHRADAVLHCNVCRLLSAYTC